MDAQYNSEKVLNYTLLAVIISVVFLLVVIVFGLTINKDATYTLSGLVLLYKEVPVFFFITAFCLFVPFGVFLLSRALINQLNKKQLIIDQHEERMNQVSQFAQYLIRQDLDVGLDLKGEDDTLGQSLANLRDVLRANRDLNLQAKKEEELRTWLGDGMAHFSELLRNHINDLEQLSFQVVKDLTKYVDAVQGGFYLLDENEQGDRNFNLMAFFAYDRRKFTDQRIKWGDGLIGTCALEQKPIHIKNVPENYISVTSGLGEANPSSLLLMPMLHENEIQGVLEFASLKNFESSHITLIEKVAESIASTLAAIKTNIKTARLLEESKAQTQTLISHEEEMRQNMEELQATQEEATRQAQRFLLLEDTINQHLIRAEFDMQGNLVYANGLFNHKFEFNSDISPEGKHILTFVHEHDKPSMEKAWKDLITYGKSFNGQIKHITRTGKDLWVIYSLSATKSEDGSIEKVMYLAVDTTDDKINDAKAESIINSYDKLGIRIELDINGNFLDSNEFFCEQVGYAKKEIKSMVIFDIIDPIELEAFNKIWDAIIKGIDLDRTIKTIARNGNEKWFQGTFKPVYDTGHDIKHIIFAGLDITREKNQENELRSLSETLKKQEKLLKESEKEFTRKLRAEKIELHEQYKNIEHIKNRLEKIMEVSPDAILTISHANRIVFFNKAAEDMWGFGKEEVMHQDVSILFSEKLTESDAFLDHLIRPGNHKIVGMRKQTRIINKRGEEKQVWILLVKAHVDNENSYTAFIQQAEVINQ
jgi:PAS domain S-box-containing protein